MREILFYLMNARTGFRPGSPPLPTDAGLEAWNHWQPRTVALRQKLEKAYHAQAGGVELWVFGLVAYEFITAGNTNGELTYRAFMKLSHKKLQRLAIERDLQIRQALEGQTQ